jgi:hypothetical protein
MVAPSVDRRFPDVTRLLVTELEVWVDSPDQAGPETPDDLQDKLPFVRAYRIGGSRDRLSDYATVSVDVFAGDYSSAEALAEDIAQWLCGPPPPIVWIDRVEPDVAPRRLPWGDERIFRWQAQYTLVTRRVPKT